MGLCKNYAASSQTDTGRFLKYFVPFVVKIPAHAYRTFTPATISPVLFELIS